MSASTSNQGDASVLSPKPETSTTPDYYQYKYIYPPNARGQEQLDIMLDMEAKGKDPMAPEYIDQEILFQTEYWHVSNNRFPYEGAEQQFLIVAVSEVYRLEDVTPEMWLDLQQVWQKLIREHNLTGGALVFRFGDFAKSGASLSRVHCHIIQPLDGAKVRPAIGGRRELKEGLHL